MAGPEHTGKPSIPLSQMGSFEQLFRREYAFVCQVVHRYVAERSKVEDIAQDIFSELWIKRDSIYIHTSVQAYLRRMAVSRALNYLRDTKKYDWDELDTLGESMQTPAVQEAEVIQHLEEQELKEKLEKAILMLPEKCRIVFLLSRNDELTYAEISRQLNISVKTVENQIGKALKLLRLALVSDRG